MTTIYYPKWVPFAEALTFSPNIVLIRAKWRDSEPVRVHELVHVAQQQEIGTLTFWWRYLTSKAKRQAFEVEAYKAQIRAGTSLDTCAGNLANNYYLGISFAQAQSLLREYNTVPAQQTGELKGS